MSPETVGAIRDWSVVIALIVMIGRDVRERRAQDDEISDRIVKLVEREAKAKVDVVKAEFEAVIAGLTAKVAALSLKVDEYGCWKGPTCRVRRPLAEPQPEDIEKVGGTD